MVMRMVTRRKEEDGKRRMVAVNVTGRRADGVDRAAVGRLESQEAGAQANESQGIWGIDERAHQASDQGARRGTKGREFGVLEFGRLYELGEPG